MVSLAKELYASADRAKDVQLMALMREQDRTPVPTDHTLPRVVLVVGPTPFSMMRGWEFFLTAPYEGVTYIATVLHNAGFPVRIVDVRFEPLPLQTAYREIIGNADLVGISTFEDNFPFVRDLIDAIKAAQPSLPVICGGSLVTSVPHVFFEQTRTDVAVISEGELTILELLRSFAEGSWDRELENVHGIVYRDKTGEVHRTPPRGQMPDLDSLPRMRLDLWPQARGPRGLQPQVISSYSRGCAMDCAFCFRTTPQVRLKSMEKLDQDLRWLKEQYGTRFVFFTDLTFFGDVEQTLAICEVIRKHDLRWTCMGRCVDAEPTRLNAMHDAGCDIILFGVESMGAQALKEVNKPTTKNINLRALNRANEAGIRFGSLMIVGLPGETVEGLETMAQWAEQHRQVCRVKYLSALPGTKIYAEGLKSGSIRSEVDHLNWLSLEQGLWEDEFLNVSRLPEAQLRQFYARIYDCYQPGPVVDFQHFPEHFQYFHPRADDVSTHAAQYAGPGWRKRFSSSGILPVAGSDRYTLERVGALGMAEQGAQLAVCGAKKLASAASARSA